MIRFKRDCIKLSATFCKNRLNTPNVPKNLQLSMGGKSIGGELSQQSAAMKINQLKKSSMA